MAFRRLFAVRDARVFLAGQAVSSFGDSALWLATGVWVKALTGSSGAAGLTFFFFFAPTLLAPITGLIVDRLPRRRVLVAVNALTGCAVLLLLLVHSAAQLWLVYVVMVLYGLFAGAPSSAPASATSPATPCYARSPAPRSAPCSGSVSAKRPCSRSPARACASLRRSWAWSSPFKGWARCWPGRPRLRWSGASASAS